MDKAARKKSSNWNIPNALSLIRIGVSPVLVLLLLSPGKGLSVICAVLFALVCLTDWLDGYLARRMNTVTTLGKFLDPLADKLLIITALIMMVPLDRVPAWMVALIVGREIAVTGLRAIAVEEGVVIDASSLGKFKTIAQIAAIIPLLLHYTFYGINFHYLGSLIFWVAFGLTLLSGADYFFKFFVSHDGGGDQK